MAGQGADDHLLDRRAPPPLTSRNVLHAKYVDNFLSISHDPYTCVSSNNALSNRLNDSNLLVHEAFGPVTSGTFVGLHIDGLTKKVQVCHRRLWKLRFANDSVLSKGSVSGAILEVLMGHLTWACLVWREMLSMFDAIYDFMRAHHDTPTPLWESVRRALV